MGKRQTRGKKQTDSSIPTFIVNRYEMHFFSSEDSRSLVAVSPRSTNIRWSVRSENVNLHTWDKKG
ncbi:hypothetical protein GCM10009000_078650 [Halobacterium noricense]